MTFAKQSSSPAAIYPAFPAAPPAEPGLVRAGSSSPQLPGALRERPGARSLRLCAGLPRRPSPSAPPGTSPASFGGDEGMGRVQTRQNSAAPHAGSHFPPGEMAESKAGVPQRPLPRSILIGTPASPWAPAVSGHPISTGTLIPVGTPASADPPALQAPLCHLWSHAVLWHQWLITSTTSTDVTRCPSWGQCHEGHWEAACWQHPGTLRAGRAQPGTHTAHFLPPPLFLRSHQSVVVCSDSSSVTLLLHLFPPPPKKKFSLFCSPPKFKANPFTPSPHRCPLCLASCYPLPRKQ